MRLTKQQVAEVCSRYQAGESSPSLAVQFGVSPTAVRGLLRRRDVERRGPCEARRFYQANHSFFHKIDTEQKAYWLGFIAADGSISGNALTISLQQRDRAHLEQLVSDMESTHPVLDYAYPTVAFSRVSVRSDELVRSLGNHGVGAAKTFSLRFPTLDLPLVHHFIRGYADGDGGFTVSPGAGSSPNITFHVTSNEEFVGSLQQVLMDACQLSNTKSYQRSKASAIFTMRYVGRRQVGRIFTYLYGDATVYLERKRSHVEPALHLNAARNIRDKHLVGWATSPSGGPPPTGLSSQPSG